MRQYRIVFFKLINILVSILAFVYVVYGQKYESPGIPLHVEAISNSARPVPFLKPEFWKGFPNLSAAAIVDFLKLVKKGKAQEIVLAPENMDKRTFDINLQQTEWINSFNFLREHCNAGLKT